MRILAVRVLVLVSGGALGASASAQVMQVVSLDSAGGLPTNGICYRPSISADGRFVVFSSSATLVPDDTNQLGDAVVRDRLLGTTERVSVGTGGIQGNDGSELAVISADGRFVAFSSLASNLVTGDTNGTWDLFVRDRQNGTTERASVSTAGAQADGLTAYSSISADGRFVAFESMATNLVPGDTNGSMDIFVRDRQLGTTERVDVSSGGVQADLASRSPAISADGRFVAFQSDATNLVAGDTNGTRDIFLRDRQLGTTVRVSVDSAGAQSNGASNDPSISSGGRYVTFRSAATNLVAGDANEFEDAFLKDLQTGATERISFTSTGGELDERAIGRSPVSDDGRYVLFATDATNVVAGDTNETTDVFLRDRQAGTTELVSAAPDGFPGNEMGEPVEMTTPMTGDGRYIAFADSSDLVPGGANDARVILVLDRFGGPSFTSLCSPGASGVIGCPCGNPAGGADRGCDNSAATGGASLSASGGTYVSSDSLVFTTTGEKPTATSVLLQGTTAVSSGAVYGQGVRCVGGTLKRLFTKTASGGSITAPNFGAGDPTVSARSAAKGNPIAAGQSRWYLVFYRDPVVLGGCPASSTFNSTQTGRIAWAP